MFAELVAGVEEVAGADPAGLADGELGPALVVLHRQISRLQAAQARLAAEFDTRRLHRADGARTAGAWLAARTRCPVSDARRWVRLGRAVRHMPATAAAWAAGDIGIAHVEVLCRARSAGRAEQFDTDEDTLVDVARQQRFFEFRRAVEYWCQAADPEQAESDAEHQHERRRLHLSETLDGMWLGDLMLDPISGAIVSDELARIDDELFKADWAAAKARLGREPTVDDLARTPAQRRADALVEMARRSRTAPASGRRPAPLFTVLVGYETFAGRICELANGAVVTPGSLIPWLDEAYIERVVFDGPSRVIDVGWWRRLFKGATRRSVQVRDRWCYHPTCDEPADRCDIDHIQPFEAGGPTIQANGRPACSHHNRNRPRARQPHPTDSDQPDPGRDPPDSDTGSDPSHTGPDPPSHDGDGPDTGPDPPDG